MKEQFIEQCMLILSREDVKKELKELFKPLVSLIVQEIYPYIYLSLVFVIISFFTMASTVSSFLKSKKTERN